MRHAAGGSYQSGKGHSIHLLHLLFPHSVQSCLLVLCTPSLSALSLFCLRHLSCLSVGRYIIVELRVSFFLHLVISEPALSLPCLFLPLPPFPTLRFPHTAAVCFAKIYVPSSFRHSFSVSYLLLLSLPVPVSLSSSLTFFCSVLFSVLFLNAFFLSSLSSLLFFLATKRRHSPPTFARRFARSTLISKYHQDQVVQCKEQTEQIELREKFTNNQRR